MIEIVVMVLYSALLFVVLVLGAPYWLLRMALSGRYRAGLAQRLGRVPADLRAAVAGRQVVWVHAVSVGEVLAATRLVRELQSALGEDWTMVVSTTTATGQALARERFNTANSSGPRVFFFPLDFAFAVRAWLRALQPRLLVLMESELWPRMLVECRRSGIPVAVVNARVSDRSFARSQRVRAIWSRLLQLVPLFLAQSDEDARRLIALGARPQSVRTIGNLKYDIRASSQGRGASLIRETAAGRPIVVAGSTHGRIGDAALSEDEAVLQAWQGDPRQKFGVLLVLAPRHPQRFAEAETAATAFRTVRASTWGDAAALAQNTEIILLDTIGDLAAVYSVASVAFVGGSLVQHGGHNPLEPAQFGVPVVMGPSFQNFRDIVARMQSADALRIVQNEDELAAALTSFLNDPDTARVMGERGRQVFEQQQGATSRAVQALLPLVQSTEVRR